MPVIVAFTTRRASSRRTPGSSYSHPIGGEHAWHQGISSTVATARNICNLWLVRSSMFALSTKLIQVKIIYHYKQRVLMHGHQGWNVRHGLCHIYMIYVYIWVVYSFCLFCCLFIIVTTQFVALYKPCKPKPKPSTYGPPDNHPLAEIQRPILRPEPKQQICHQHANTDHFGKQVNRWYYNQTQSSTWATKIPPKIRVEVNCNYYVHPNLTDI